MNRPPSSTGPAPTAGGSWLVMAAAVLWGTTGTAQALAPPGAAPLAVGVVRQLIGTVALVIFAHLSGQLRHRHAWPLRPTLIAGAGMATFQVTFFAGVQRTGVALGTIVAIGSAPIIAGLLEATLCRRPPARRWLWATGLGLVGGALLLWPMAGAPAADAGGLMLTLLAGTGYAVYIVAGKALVSSRPPVAAQAAIFSVGMLLLLPLLALVDLGWLARPQGALVALHLGVMTTAVAYVLFSAGLQSVTAATAATLSLAEPLTAALLGVLLLGEQLTAVALSGAGLLLLSLILLTMTPRFTPWPRWAGRSRL